MTRNLTQVAGSFIGTMEEFHTSEKKPLVSPIIHITDSQTAKILDTIPLGDFWDDNHHKSLKDTLEYFEFRTFGDKRYSQYLEKMNRIIIPDEDGTFREFVIFHAIKYRLQSAVVIDVYAPASYLLLKKAKVIKPQRISEYTASQHLRFALNGTEWRPGIVESDKYRTLDIENHTNPYAYIKRIANEFELEPRFRVETDGNKVIGRYVDLLERVGQWQGREVEFGRDLLGIERKVDDSNVVTALIGLAPERDDGTRLEVMVEDEEALQRWGIPNPQTGELMHLIETYEPESTDQDMTVERLTELTRNELEKRVNSVVEYTADVADLEKVPGMENKIIRFGDTIKIKDVGFNPPLYLEARVHTQDRSLSQPEKKKVTLGDYIEYTEEEVQAIWRQLQSEVRRRITAKQLYDYTYPKLVIDSKDDEVRTDVESYARTVAADAKNEAITYTNNTLEPIAVRVDNVEEDIKNHQELISKAQTDIIQAYNEIELRATKTEVDTLSGRVNQAESQITQLAGQIELRATKTEVDELTGRVSTVESTIQQHADMIESKIDDGQARSIFRQEASSFTFEASQINFRGHVFGENATFTGHLEGASGSFRGEVISQYSTDFNEYKAEIKEGSLFLENRELVSGTQQRVLLNGRGLHQSISDDLFHRAPLEINGRYGIVIQSLSGAIELNSEVIISSFNEPLWTGAAYPLSSHTITPSKKITDCMTGWILRWQAYDRDAGAVINSDFHYVHIPKIHVIDNNGAGVRFVLERDGVGTISKYVYVYNDRIVGHDSNQLGANYHLVLSGVFEY